MSGDYREVLSRVRLRPLMYLFDESFASHATFANGLDAGTGGDALDGFRDFLLNRIGALTPWRSG